jgi:general stress protein CsbA
MSLELRAPHWLQELQLYFIAEPNAYAFADAHTLFPYRIWNKEWVVILSTFTLLSTLNSNKYFWFGFILFINALSQLTGFIHSAELLN